MNWMIDTHCHLDLFKDIQNNPGLENNLGIKTITVTNAPTFFQKNHDLFKSMENIRVAIGLHPQLAMQYSGDIDLFGKLIGSTRYVGEIGLDGSPELKQTHHVQVTLFQKILKLVKDRQDKILTIHSRNASREVIETLSSLLSNTNNKIILHWFSGTREDLKDAIKKGYYFSINHKMASSEKGKGIIKQIPNELLLTETDAPFTFGGSIKNRLQSIELTLQSIASNKSIDVSECQELIYQNFINILSK